MASLLPSSWTAIDATGAAPARAVLASAAVVALMSMGVLAAVWLVAFVRRFRCMAAVLEPVPKPPAPTKVTSSSPIVACHRGSKAGDSARLSMLC